MARVNYTPAPRMMMPQNTAMQSFAGGMEMGQNIQGAVQGRKRRKAIMKILGQPGKITREQLMEIGKLDPEMAVNVAKMTMVISQLEGKDFDNAINTYTKFNEVSAQIASTLLQTPQEQRQQRFVQMMSPLVNNPATKGFAREIAKDYQDGDLSDETLLSVAVRAVGTDTYLKARGAESARKAKEARDDTVREDEQAHEIELARVKLEGKETPQQRRAREESVERIKQRKNVSQDQKAGELIRKVKAATGKRLSYAAANYVLNADKAVWAQDEMSGAKLHVIDEKGQPIDLAPFYEYLHGEEEADTTMDLSKAGDPSVVMEALRKSVAPPSPTNPPAAPRRRRPQVPDMLQTNPL